MTTIVKTTIYKTIGRYGFGHSFVAILLFNPTGCLRKVVN